LIVIAVSVLDVALQASADKPLTQRTSVSRWHRLAILHLHLAVSARDLRQARRNLGVFTCDDRIASTDAPRADSMRP